MNSSYYYIKYSFYLLYNVTYYFISTIYNVDNNLEKLQGRVRSPPFKSAAKNNAERLFPEYINNSCIRVMWSNAWGGLEQSNVLSL